jgi:hypothetical protein
MTLIQGQALCGIHAARRVPAQTSVDVRPLADRRNLITIEQA